MEDLIREIEQHYNYMVNKVEIVKQQFAAAEEQNEILAAEKATLIENLNREQLINEELRREKSENENTKELSEVAQRCIKLFEQELSMTKKTKQHLENVNQQMENEIKELQNKIGTIQKSEWDIKKENIVLKTEIEKKEAEISILVQNVEKYKGELDEKRDLITFYCNENELKEHKITFLEEYVRKNFNTKSNNDDMTTTSFNENSPNNTDVSETGREQEIYENELKQCTDKQIELEKKLNNKDEEITKLKDEINNLTESAREAKNRFDEEIGKSTQNYLLLENQSNEQLKKVDELMKANGELSKKLEIIKNDFNNVEAVSLGRLQTIDDLKEEIKNLEDISMERLKIIDNMKEEMEQLQSMSVEKLKDIESLEETIVRLRDELDAIKGYKHMYETVESDYDELKREITELEATSLNISIRIRSFLVDTTLGNSFFILKPMVAEKNLLNLLSDIEYLSNSMLEQIKSDEKTIKQLKDNKPNNRKSTFAKQEIKIEKLENRIEILESLQNAHQKVFEENGIYKEQLKSSSIEIANLKDKLTETEMLNRKTLKEIEQFKQNNIFLNGELNLSKTKYEKVVVEYKNCITKINDLSNQLNLYLNEIQYQKNIIENVRKEFTRINNNCCYLEIELKKRNVENESYKKDIQQIKMKENQDLKKAQEELKGYQKKFNDVTNFLTNIFGQLDSITSAVISSNNFVDPKLNDLVVTELLEHIHWSKNKFSSELDKEMFKLNHQIKLFSILMKMYTNLTQGMLLLKSSPNRIDAEVQTMPCSSSTSSSSDDDEDFITETCFIDSEEILIQLAFPNLSDSFLENLELDGDFSGDHVSKQEIEDKFVTLAVALKMNFKNINERYGKQKKRCERLIEKYNHITNSIKDFRKNNEKGKYVIKSLLLYLETLNNICLDSFVTAKRFGVLQYEFRMMKCWNFLINYVATLKNNSKGLSTALVSTNPIVQKQSPFELIQNNRHVKQKSKNLILWIFLFNIFLLFVLFYINIVHIFCINEAKFKYCPLDNIFNILVYKYYDDYDFPI